MVFQWDREVLGLISYERPSKTAVGRENTKATMQSKLFTRNNNIFTPFTTSQQITTAILAHASLELKVQQWFCSTYMNI